MRKENTAEAVYARFLSALRSMQVQGGVLVALSGGADSVCLLDLFCQAQKNGDFPYAIAAAHLNHALRGEESDRDEDFCSKLCAKYGVPLFKSRVDVRALAKGKSIEEAAREARYAFFADTLREGDDLTYVATAHHLGDFCETMLLNLVRGSGINGLCSIPRMRGNILRPLLDCNREEILAYNAQQGLDFVTDSTNLSFEYSRNRIRHRVLPELAKISEGYADSMARTAALLASDADFLRTAAEQAYVKTVQTGVLNTKQAQNLHPALLSRIVKMLYTQCMGAHLAEVHIDAITGQIKSGKADFSVSVPGGICHAERGELTFTAALPKCNDFALPITVGTPVALPCGITVLLSEQADGTPLLAEALSGTLTVRSRREGDTLRQFGKTHKIKRMIADKKLSATEKAKLFFLVADGEILFTNLPATADRAFPRADGGPCIYIKIEETL